MKNYDKGNSGHARKPFSLTLKQKKFGKRFYCLKPKLRQIFSHSTLRFKTEITLTRNRTRNYVRILQESPVSLSTFLIIIPHMVHVVLIWCCCVYIVLINKYCRPPYQRKRLVCFQHFPHPFTVFVSRVYSAFLYIFLTI